MGGAIASAAIGKDLQHCIDTSVDVSTKKKACKKAIATIQDGFSNVPQTKHILQCALGDPNHPQTNYCNNVLDDKLSGLKLTDKTSNILKCVLGSKPTEGEDVEEDYCSKYIGGLKQDLITSMGTTKAGLALKCIFSEESDDTECSNFSSSVLGGLDLGSSLVKALTSPKVIALIVGFTIVAVGLVILVAWIIHRYVNSKPVPLS